MPRNPEDIPDATLRLLLAPRAGAVLTGRLREHFGSDEAVVVATASQLAEVRGVGRGLAAAIRQAIDEARPTWERQCMSAAGARMIVGGDVDYPALLEAIPDPPAMHSRFLASSGRNVARPSGPKSLTD